MTIYERVCRELLWIFGENIGMIIVEYPSRRLEFIAKEKQFKLIIDKEYIRHFLWVLTTVYTTVKCAYEEHPDEDQILFEESLKENIIRFSLEVLTLEYSDFVDY